MAGTEVVMTAKWNPIDVQMERQNASLGNGG
jgi:hypothetical protein